MKRHEIEQSLDAGAGPNTERNQRATILAVGDIEEWARHRGTLPVNGKLAFSSFTGVSAELFDVLAPEIVLSPLLARGFDCIDLAQVLSLIGFQGRYYAVCDALPDPGIIRREIRALCPELDFDVIEVPPDKSRPN
jgi:hypothetical protein